MKLNASVFRLALQELDNHLYPDLQFTIAFRHFMKHKVDAETYLASEFGFKKFILVYGIGRTLGAGDECKLNILKAVRTFPFGKSHIENISSLAATIRQQGLSSNVGKGGFGLPRSFCSKLLYVYKPDEIIPYDSYVLKSLTRHTGKPVKDLQQYYDLANEFRLTYFPENGTEVLTLRKKHDDQHLSKMKTLRINPDKLLSWKLADKYLWCEDEVRRKE